MLVFLLVTLLSVFVTAIVSGGNEESYIQSRDILGWKVEEGNGMRMNYPQNCQFHSKHTLIFMFS